MHVLKFGGTSMVDAKSWRRVLTIIANSKNPVVVVSATDRTTRHLAEAAQTAVTDLADALKTGDKIGTRHQTIVTQFLDDHPEKYEDGLKEKCFEWIQTCASSLSGLLEKINAEGTVSPKNIDAVLSIGEQLSARLFAMCGPIFGLEMNWLDARSIIKTDNNFGNAKPDLNKIDGNIYQLEEKISKNIIPVIGGFYGENGTGQITTLGFEGSDYSASLIGAALNAETIEIWTDVSGIYSCDPRIITTAKPIEKLSFNDAEQLANHGAKVLHPASVHPAGSKNIPVLVKNIFQPQHPGTTVSTSAADAGLCKAIAFVKNVTVLNINTENRNIRNHRLVKVFSILNDYEPAIIAIKTEKGSAITVFNETAQIDRLKKELSEVTSVCEIENQSLIGLIGCTALEPELLEQVNNILQHKQSFLIYSEDTGVLNMLVDEAKLLDTVKQLHQTFFE